MEYLKNEIKEFKKFNMRLMQIKSQLCNRYDVDMTSKNLLIVLLRRTITLRSRYLKLEWSIVKVSLFILSSELAMMALGLQII